MASSSNHSILDGFKLDRILDQDPKSKSVNLLGTLDTYLPNEMLSSRERAILLVEKTHFPQPFLDRLRESPTRSNVVEGVETSSELDPAEQKVQPQNVRSDRPPIFSKVSDLGQNDIYTWLLAHFGSRSVDADVKITLIRGATQAHIDKYSAQRKVMVYETPEMYQQKVLPWIESFPPSRIQWVYNILEHKKEADSILFEDPDPKSGFIVVPDLKWDQNTTSSLYIQAIVHNRELKSIRDLTNEHIGMLDNIKKEASRVALEKYGLTGRDDTADGNVRCFLHYHPSY
ncbi:scavenger mRNA decapping enzyme [Pseudozyma hubeiensis SY62]|uniref:Scavenger mRNA decapping enzyme n=1 Tax=Pseudozyma hubeiensis (strain SY62) TaxID=1305764 RepID=R9P4F9_PSEHS|nr:scavenger mRNA decapping enzyme [Pseudozyma hubeiensis SY62]GAC96189.1 scavenger mRNA decapping enzyme [Pseudozyma hubeiensis SY62]